MYKRKQIIIVIKSNKIIYKLFDLIFENYKNVHILLIINTLKTLA